ncbi:MAG TPA: hypothetical protein DIU14_05535, partial [Actinobacteria bacterium]|nr:hypothetical protein [Actinomycetota bacterium]
MTSARSLGRAGAVLGLGSVGLAAAGIVLVRPYWHMANVGGAQQAAGAFIAFTFAPVGAFLAYRRPRNPIAWVFLAIGLSQSLAVFALYGTALVAAGDRSTWADVLTWMETWVWSPGFVFIPTLLLQLFPTGRPLSELWRWLVRATLLGLGMGMLGLAFHRQTTGRTAAANVPLGYRSPVPTGHAFDPVAAAGFVVLVLCTVASVVSIIARYRRSRGEEREQLKWFAAAAVGTVALLTYGSLLPATMPVGIRAVTFVGIPLLPVAAAVAIMKYRLYDIDVVINKTVVFGALAAFITAVYVAIVVGIGAAIGQGSKPNLGLSILATAVVAVAFQPVRERMQRLANRLVYGRRATPYEVLSEFSSRMAGAYESEDLLPRMARILAEGTGAGEATVWLKVGSELRAEASFPAESENRGPLALPDGELPDLSATLALPVHHRGELLGALSLTKAAGERLTPAEEKLAGDL